MIKKLLVNNIRDNVPDDKVAVLLSGGVDSISVAFSADHLGKSVNAYSFQLSDKPSSDYAKAKDIAEIMGWNFTGINIPTTNLANDFHHLLKLGCQKKTHFECVFPFMYLYPEIKEEEVLSGWAADGYYGISKKAMLHYGPGKPKEKFDDENFASNNQDKPLYRSHSE